MAGRGLSTNAQNIFFWHSFPPSPELWLFLKRFYINKMLLHIFKLNLLNFCQIHEQISLATYNTLKRGYFPNQLWTTSEHHFTVISGGPRWGLGHCYYELWMLCAGTCPCFYLRAAALNVQIRMEDGMNEIQIYSLRYGISGANFAWPPAAACTWDTVSEIALLV